MRRALSIAVRFEWFGWLSVCLATAGCAQGSEMDSPTDAGNEDVRTPDANVPTPDAAAKVPDANAYDFGSDPRPFPEATFVGSEATVVRPELGSVAEQLHRGLRYLQFPVQDDDFRQRGDFALGVDAPRDQINLGGDNPSDEDLSDWLEAIARWSDAYPNHAPITVALDLRDDLTDNVNFDEGDLFRLNEILKSALGEKILLAPSVDEGTWPSVDDMRGKVIVLLAGHEQSRARYRELLGTNPTIAGDADGAVVAVHEHGFFELRYLLGARAGAEVRWTRGGFVPGYYVKPSLAINEQGLLVLVASSPPTDEFHAVYMTVGEVLPAGGVFWRDTQVLDTGELAVVRFLDPTSSTVEVLVDPRTSTARRYEISVRRNDGATNVLKMEESMAVAWDTDIVRGEEEQFIRVLGDESGVLRYETESRRRPIAPEQLAFTEYKKGDHATLQRWFRYSVDPTEIQTWLAQGLVVRAPYAEALLTFEQLPTLIVTTEPFIQGLEAYREAVTEDPPAE